MPFQPGQSGNPSGRPRGAAGLARAVRERVGENLEQVIDVLVAILNDPLARRSDRLAAAGLLLDRAAGKPHASSSVNVTASAVALPVGWDQMSNNERTAWADSLRERALAGVAGLLGPGDEVES